MRRPTTPRFMSPTVASTQARTEISTAQVMESSTTCVGPPPGSSAKGRSWVASAARHVGLSRASDSVPRSTNKEARPPGNGGHKVIAKERHLASTSQANLKSTARPFREVKDKELPTSKPLPSPPVASVEPTVASSGSRSLLDAGDRPLRRSPPGRPTEVEEWPTMSPEKVSPPSPSKQRRPQGNGGLQREQLTRNIERYPRLTMTDFVEVKAGEAEPGPQRKPLHKGVAASSHLLHRKPIGDAQKPGIEAKSQQEGQAASTASSEEVNLRKPRNFSHPRQTRTSSLRARISSGANFNGTPVTAKALGASGLTSAMAPRGKPGLNPPNESNDSEFGDKAPSSSLNQASDNVSLRSYGNHPSIKNVASAKRVSAHRTSRPSIQNSIRSAGSAGNRDHVVDAASAVADVFEDSPVSPESATSPVKNDHEVGPKSKALLKSFDEALGSAYSPDGGDQTVNEWTPYGVDSSVHTPSAPQGDPDRALTPKDEFNITAPEPFRSAMDDTEPPPLRPGPLLPESYPGALWPPRTSSRVAGENKLPFSGTTIAPKLSKEFRLIQDGPGHSEGKGKMPLKVEAEGSRRVSQVSKQSSQGSHSKKMLSMSNLRGMFRRSPNDAKAEASRAERAPNRSREPTVSASGSPFPSRPNGVTAPKKRQDRQERAIAGFEGRQLRAIAGVEGPQERAIAVSATQALALPVTPTVDMLPATPPSSGQILDTTSLTMQILESAKKETHSGKKERLLEMGKIMVNIITHARDAEKAMEQASLAARKAEMAYMLTNRTVLDVARRMELWKESMETA